MRVLERVGVYTLDVACALVALACVYFSPAESSLWWGVLVFGGGRLLVRLRPELLHQTVTAVYLLVAVWLFQTGVFYPFGFVAKAFAATIVLARLAHHQNIGPQYVSQKLGKIAGSKEVRRAARRALRGRRVQKGTYTARWADSADLAQANMFIEPSEGFGRNLYLAWSALGIIGVKEGHAGRRELGHFLVGGATRSGKGRMLTANAVMWPESLVFLDIKGENYRLTSGVRARWSRVYALHPNGRGHRFDPFAEMRGSEEGLRTAANIIMDPGQDKQPVFAQTAENALFAAFLGARLEGVPTLPYVKALLDEGVMGFVEHLAGLNDPAINSALTRFTTVRPSEFTLEFFSRESLQRGAWGTLNTRCSAFMTEGVMAMMSGSDFHASDLYEENTSLYLIFPESQTAATSKAFQVVMTALMNALIEFHDEQEEAGSKPERQVLWLLDEAGRTPIPHLDRYIATVAGRGMTVGLVIQDIPQLIETYGVSERTVRGNIRTQVWYTPTEETTARYLEGRLGQFSIVYERQDIEMVGGGNIVGEGINIPVPGIPIAGPSEIVRESHRPLLTQDELYRMPLDDVIIFAAAIPPVYERRLEPNNIFNDVAEWPPAAPLTKLEPVTYTLPQRPPAVANGAPRPVPDPPEATAPTPGKREGPLRVVQIRPTYPGGLEAAAAALRLTGRAVTGVQVVRQGATSGGVAYEVYTDGQEEVTVCEQEAGCYVVADPEELELDTKGLEVSNEAQPPHLADEPSSGPVDPEF